MKKIALALCATLAAGTLMLTTSYHKSAKVDTSGWVSSFDDGITAAKKENKRVILFFSSDEDGTSRTIKDNLLETADFLAAETPKYVLVNIDFSASRYEAAMSLYSGETEPSEKEQKAALAAQEALTRDMKQAMYLSAQESPSFYVLTRQGYPAAQFTVDENVATVADFDSLLAEKEEDIADYEALVAAAESEKGIEKARAIDALFEATTAEWRYMVLPLCAEMEKLDPKNETGFGGKHILALANGKATDSFLAQDYASAAAAFVEASEHAFLSVDEKQEALYTAAYLLAQSGSTDYAAIRAYAEQSYNAAPESEHADMIKAFIGQVDQQIDLVEQMQKNVELTADEGYTTINPSAAPDAPAAPDSPDAE